MSLGEFEIISRYFKKPASGDVLLGIGDDAAVVSLRSGQRLAVAMDTIVEGVHFPKGTDAADIGYRALAVNLSDLAAMGAVPKWITLSLSLPSNDESWLDRFASGLFELASKFNVQLIGGDTVRGPLVVTIQIAGWVESNRWLTRSGAQVGDLIFVSGCLGDAAGGLAALQELSEITESTRYLKQRFLRPQPRVSLGRELREIASASMDISDGLLTDLDKLCAASAMGAELDVDRVPMSSQLRGTFDADRALNFALAGGDDYELLFTVHAADQSRLRNLKTPLAHIGKITALGTVRCVRNGATFEPNARGYDHFHSGARK
jgi:thiamine-monophosphate kinase